MKNIILKFKNIGIVVSLILTIAFYSTSNVKSEEIIENKTGIWIIEIMPSPNKGEKEYVTIFNDNNKALDLTNYYLDDIYEGGSKPIKINKIIKPKSSETIFINKNMLNGTGDDVYILDEEMKPIISVSYKKPIQGISFIRNKEGYWEKNYKNIKKDSEVKKPEHIKEYIDVEEAKESKPTFENKEEQKQYNPKTYIIKSDKENNENDYKEKSIFKKIINWIFN